MGSAQWGRRDNNEGLITIDLSDHTDTGDIISVQHVASRPHARTPAHQPSQVRGRKTVLCKYKETHNVIMMPRPGYQGNRSLDKFRLFSSSNIIAKIKTCLKDSSSTAV